VGEVIAFADIVFLRRRRRTRQAHARCLEILAASVESARAELEDAPAAERWVWMRRLRKLEELAEYAGACG
jgi:hypothetical protein